MTLDLTTPHVPPTRKAQPLGGRNRKVRWVNTGLAVSEKQAKRRPLTSKGKDSAEEGTQNEATAQVERDDEDEDDNTDEEEEDDDVEERTGNDVNQKDGQGSPKAVALANEDPKKPPSVQILDLHSKNPVVSYDGHIYSCQWVSNIGTELLFTRHDPNNPLPNLRTLPGDVDLLAASSARIVSTSVEVHPKEPSATHPWPSSRPSGKVPELAIPVGRGASVHRKDQARFLESLMDIKEEKGEDDPVTVYAHARKTVWKWNEQFSKKQSAEKAKLLKVIKRGGKAAKLAREKMATIEKDEARRKEQVVTRNRRGPEAGKKRSSVYGNAPKPKRGRPRRKGLGALAATPEPHAPADLGTPGYEMASMAASTPQRFESEEREDSQMEDEEMEEGGSGEEELYDAEDLYDEDAPGEDDDTHMYEGYG